MKRVGENIDEKWLNALRKSVDTYKESITDEQLESGWARLEAERRAGIAGQRRWIAWSVVSLAAAVAILVLLIPSIHNRGAAPDANSVQIAASDNSYAANSFIIKDKGDAKADVDVDAGNSITRNRNVNWRGSITVNRAGNRVANKIADRTDDEIVNRRTADNETVTDDGAKNDTKKSAEKSADKSTENNTGKRTAVPAERKGNRNKYVFDEPVRVSKRGKWTAGLLTGSGGATGKSGGESNIMLALPIGSDGAQFALLQQFAVSVSPASYSHKQPWSFGVTVEKAFGRSGRFSIESGIIYTLLNSDVSSGSYNLKQHLHYLGIPVSAKWKIADSKKFSVYVSGGGMAEKCVAGRMESKNKKPLSKEKFNIDPVQFSVAANAGAEFKVYKDVGIYVQPGVSYYFKRGSLGTFYVSEAGSDNGRAFEIETIHTKNRIGLNIQTGMRITF